MSGILNTSQPDDKSSLSATKDPSTIKQTSPLTERQPDHQTD